MTAVEWLSIYIKSVTNCNEFIQHAKNLERQQIIDAYNKGEFNQGCNETAEEYYSQTYKGGGKRITPPHLPHPSSLPYQ